MIHVVTVTVALSLIYGALVANDPGGWRLTEYQRTREGE